MRIQHNIMALNASNRLKSNDSAISSNIAKLSSGYRINSAADDAAGLAVSEKMRSQINGLNQAEDNAQNGISLVQTAEGGLNETSSILQRMNTLAVESANGTYQNDTDRANLQKEVTALQSEIDTISTSTNFNQINLLDGSLSTATVGVSSAVGGSAVTTAAATAGVYNAASALTGDATATHTVAVTVNYTDASGKSQNTTATVTYNADTTYHTTDGTKFAAADDAIAYELNQNSTFSSQFTSTTNGGNLAFTAKTTGTDAANIVSLSESDNGGTAAAVTVSKAANTGTNAASNLGITGLKTYGSTGDTTTASDAIFTVNGQKFAFAATAADAQALGSDVNAVVMATGETTGSTLTNADATKMASLIQQKTGLTASANTTTISLTSAGEAVTFQVGSDNASDQRVSLSIGDMSSTGLGIQDVNVATQKDAEAAIDTIKSAINKVDGTRADLGALQNQLEHTSNNLSTMSENLTSAESNIRDVDMSDEYVQYSKNQILSQAATAMLAQANTAPQNVLTLLKG